MVITLLFMLVLALIGSAALITSALDLRMTGSQRIQKQAFYAADAGLGFVRATPPLPLTSIDYSNPGPHRFRNPNSSAARFSGDITWKHVTTYPVKGSKNGGRQGIKSHLYTMNSTGYSVNQAQKTLEMRAFRDGF